MIGKDKLDRINELARKSKKVGLSQEEKIEQHQLRQEYLSSFRQSFQNQIESMTVVDREGNDVTPEKIKKLKKDHKK